MHLKFNTSQTKFLISFLKLAPSAASSISVSGKAILLVPQAQNVGVVFIFPLKPRVCSPIQGFWDTRARGCWKVASGSPSQLCQALYRDVSAERKGPVWLTARRCHQVLRPWQEIIYPHISVVIHTGAVWPAAALNAPSSLPFL